MYTVDTKEHEIVNEHLSGTSYAGRLVSPESIDYTGRYNPIAYVVVTECGVLAVVFGESNDSDALDAAVDAGKLDCMQQSSEDESFCCYHHSWHKMKDAIDNCEFEGISYLGNASEAFDLSNVNIFELPASDFLLDPAVIDAIGETVVGAVLYQVRSAKSEAIETDYLSNDERNDWKVYGDAERFLEEHLASNFSKLDEILSKIPMKTEDL